MATIFERNQPVLLQPANAAEENMPHMPAPATPEPSRFAAVSGISAGVLAAFWIGVWAAYLLGYFGFQGLAHLDLQQIALFGAAILLPPAFFIAVAVVLGRAS